MSAASLAMMADRARLTTWTGGSRGARRETKQLTEMKVGVRSPAV